MFDPRSLVVDCQVGAILEIEKLILSSESVKAYIEAQDVLSVEALSNGVGRLGVLDLLEKKQVFIITLFLNK